MLVSSTDPRDSEYEVTTPVFRVDLWSIDQQAPLHHSESSPGYSRTTYTLADCDVMQVLDWILNQQHDSFTLYLIVEAEIGKGLHLLAGVDPTAVPSSS